MLGKGNVEAEFKREGAHASGGRRNTSIANAYPLGIAQRADLAVGFYNLFAQEGTEPSERGMGDTQLTIKTFLFEGDALIPDIGAKAGVILPTGDPEKGFGNGRASATPRLIADWEAGRALVHSNAGLTVSERPVGSRDRDDAASASLAIEWKIWKTWTAGGEHIWQKNIGASDAASSEILVGGKWDSLPDVTLDAGLRFGTTASSPNVAFLAGLTLAFSGSEGSERSGEGVQKVATPIR